MTKKSDLELVVSQIAVIDKVMNGRLNAWLVLLSEIHGNFRKSHSKNQLEVIQRFEELLNDPLPITEITIIKGGIKYTFLRNNDIFPVYSLIDAIDQHLEKSFEYRKSRGVSIYEEYKQEIKGAEHHTDMAKLLFNHAKVKKILPIERQRFLLMWELYRRAGYPFDKQQLEASDQNKASLIRNWFKRNKNQKILD